MRSSAASTRCMLRKALLSQAKSAPPTTARSVSATTASRSVKPSCRAGISGSSRARRGGLKQQRMCRAPMMDLQLSAQANSVCHVTYRRPSSNRPAIGQSQQLLGNRPALTNEQLPPIAAHAIAQGLQLIEQIVQRGPARPGLLHPHQAGQRHRSNGPDDHQHHQQFEQGERGLVNVWARNRHRHPGLSHRAAHPRPDCRE